VGLCAIDIGDGPPVVLLHGQPGNAGDWGPVTSRLRDRFRVIAADRPGYGRTGGRAVGFVDNAAAVVELLDRLGIGSALVVGHSWASGVALAAAVRFPERVTGLVLAAPVSPAIRPSLADRLLAQPHIGRVAVRVGFGLAAAGLALPPVRHLAHRAVRELSPEQVAATAQEWRTAGVWKSFYAEQRFLINELPALAPQVRGLATRATILYGERDRIAPPAHAHSLGRCLAGAQLVSADRAGHMLPQQRPELVAEAIVRAA
jgi:pimeloyl-ACP methyl ester carboxylesterase